MLDEIGASLRCVDDKYYLYKDDEITKVPKWVARSLCHERQMTYWWGPYMMYNGYEESANGQYLIGMFKYPHLIGRAQLKVDRILQEDSEWVKVNKEFMEALNERQNRIVQHAIAEYKRYYDINGDNDNQP